MGCNKKQAEIKEVEPVVEVPSEEIEEIGEITRIEIIEQAVTFSEAVSLSDSIAIAEYIECKENEEVNEYKFKILESLKGEMETEIYVFDYPRTVYVEGTAQRYSVESSVYKEGEQYLLIMNKNDSLFYDYPHYVPVTDVYIPMNNIEQGRLQGKSILDNYGIRNNEDLRMAIGSTSYTTVDNERLKKQYTETTDSETIIKESDYVLEVEISSIMSEGTDNGNFYYCKVLNILKGQQPLIFEENTEELQIKFLKNSVEIGKKYIVTVNHVTETSYLYLQSAKDGIIDVEETEKVAEIKSILGI